MIASFADEETQAIYQGRGSAVLLEHVVALAERMLDLLDAAQSLADLETIPGAELLEEPNGFHSMRLTPLYRLKFRWEAAPPAAFEVELLKTAL